jgi:hypothetical protein
MATDLILRVAVVYGLVASMLLWLFFSGHASLACLILARLYAQWHQSQRWLTCCFCFRKPSSLIEYFVCLKTPQHFSSSLPDISRLHPAQVAQALVELVRTQCFSLCLSSFFSGIYLTHRISNRHVLERVL